MFTGNDLAGVFDGVIRGIFIGAIALLICVPLAIWKLYDLACWLF